MWSRRRRLRSQDEGGRRARTGGDRSRTRCRTPAHVDAFLSGWTAEGGPRSWHLPQDRDQATVGRATDADVHVDGDSQVSRLHARLERVAGQWSIVDDGLSRNGTMVNGKRVTQRVRLHDRDRITVGETLLVFCAPEQTGTDQTAVADAVPLPRNLTEAQLRGAAGAVPALPGRRAVHLAGQQPGDRQRAVAQPGRGEDAPAHAVREVRASATCRRTRSAHGSSSSRSAGAWSATTPEPPSAFSRETCRVSRVGRWGSSGPLVRDDDVAGDGGRRDVASVLGAGELDAGRRPRTRGPGPASRSAPVPTTESTRPPALTTRPSTERRYRRAGRTRPRPRRPPPARRSGRRRAGSTGSRRPRPRRSPRRRRTTAAARRPRADRWRQRAAAATAVSAAGAAPPASPGRRTVR